MIGVTPSPPIRKKVAVRDGTDYAFVAALTSKKSRVDALAAFTDLQQNYPDLQGMAPDVKEVEIPEKGTWYRLVVGPPGSKESASDLCKKLKAQGLRDCWVTAY